jgi:hypothetical protein
MNNIHKGVAWLTKEKKEKKHKLPISWLKPGLLTTDPSHQKYNQGKLQTVLHVNMNLTTKIKWAMSLNL